MNDFEQNLRGKLNARADAVLVDDDWDDLMQRMLRRSRNTTRALALALVLVVGAGTVAVAATVRNDHSAAPAAVGPKVKPAGDGVVPTHAKVPTVPSASTGGASYAKAASQPGGTLGSSEVLVNGASTAWIAVGDGGPNTPMAKRVHAHNAERHHYPCVPRRRRGAHVRGAAVVHARGVVLPQRLRTRRRFRRRGRRCDDDGSLRGAARTVRSWVARCN